MSKGFVRGTCLVVVSAMVITMIIGGISMFIH